MTEDEAQAIHRQRQYDDPIHPRETCVCCCFGCEDLVFDCVGDRGTEVFRVAGALGLLHPGPWRQR